MTSLISFLSALAQNFGWVPLEFQGHTKFFSSLGSRGISLNTVVDVGAHRGNWTRAEQKVLPSSDFYLIDPNNDHETVLRSLGVYIQALLSDEEKTIDFYQLGGTGDSYMREQTFVYEKVTPIKTTARRGDTLKELPSGLDLIKVDTQGSELEVLAGFGNSLAETKVVILEVPLYESNQGAPRFNDYLDFMADLGFLASSVLYTQKRNNDLYALDLAFLRGNSERSIL
jgi:FkbM family methyltransferase